MSVKNPIRCVSCGAQFLVQWVDRGDSKIPEYCPFCGDECLDLEIDD